MKAARHAELDVMRGISANVMVGQEGLYGTSAFQVVLDLEEMKKLEQVLDYEMMDESKEISSLLEQKEEDVGDKCSVAKLKIHNDVINIKSVDTGKADEDYDLGI